MSSNFINYSTLNSEQSREDVCVSLKNQQTHTSHNQEMSDFHSDIADALS